MTATAVQPTPAPHILPSSMLRRQTSLPIHDRQRSVSISCPAKTNLTLHVGERHQEWGGRHVLETTYCAIGIYDTVTVSSKAFGSGFSLEITGTHLGDLASSDTDMRSNHAVRALLALSEASGHEPDVALRITKHIPVGAGLGGGSADAAATLLALNALWHLDWPVDRLRGIAAGLGADMPFCLTGGYARGAGYGDRIIGIPPESDQAMRLQRKGFAGRLLVGAYHCQLSTADVYAMFDTLGPAEHDANHLQRAAVAMHPRSGEALEAARAAGADLVFVSGSGPSVIAFTPDADVAASVQSAWLRLGVVDRILAATAPATPHMHPLTYPGGAS